jgi:hypothetical protein
VVPAVLFQVAFFARSLNALNDLSALERREFFQFGGKSVVRILREE